MLDQLTESRRGALRPIARHTTALAALLSLLVSAGAALAQPDAGVDAGAAPVQTEPLRVGFAGSAPFVLPSEQAGLSIGAWRLVADGANVRYSLVREPSVAAALEKVARGELDVAVGPISITADRARSVRFTQPYFQSSLAIAAPEGSGGFWARLKPFLTWGFAGATALLLLVLGIVGLLMWVFERKKNPEQFPKSPLRGIGNGIWFALVTMTTVGYGDRVPVTVAGRIVAGTWMLIAILTATSLLAGIASAITVSQLQPAAIRTADDLSGHKVAVVRRTTAAAFAREHGAVTVPVDDLAAAFQMVAAGRARALVFDRPMVTYYLSQHPELDLRVSPRRYEPQGYGFAVRPGAPGLGEQLNVALLESLEAGAIARVVGDWLGAGE